MAFTATDGDVGSMSWPSIEKGAKDSPGPSVLGMSNLLLLAGPRLGQRLLSGRITLTIAGLDEAQLGLAEILLEGRNTINSL